MYIVITENGFMTTKKKEDILDTDDICHSNSEQECNDIIHGKSKKSNEENYKKYPTIDRDNTIK